MFDLQKSTKPTNLDLQKNFNSSPGFLAAGLMFINRLPRLLQISWLGLGRPNFMLSDLLLFSWRKLLDMKMTKA